MEHKRLLFCAESVYQLLNAITLRIMECAESECDLILSNLTCWNEDMLCRLQKTGLFGQIIRPMTREMERRFWDLSLQDKQKVVNKPVAFFQEGKPPIEPVYDALFCPIDHIFWKMLYHYQMDSGVLTQVYLYDEGIRAYTMDILSTDNQPYLQGKYAEAPFIGAVVAYYLYQPDLYSVKKHPYQLRQLPNPAELPLVRQKLLEVFGEEKEIGEPYIYLEDFFFADRCISNDFDLFHQVSALVGKENIIVKRHPRCMDDRFSPFGYKILERSVVPWEIQLLTNDLKHKVLISVSSTSIFTPYMIFHSDMHVISLEKMFYGINPAHEDAGFASFLHSLTQRINQKEVRFHTPSSLNELEYVLKYIVSLQESVETDD